jgi:HEAT repeat protein
MKRVRNNLMPERYFFILIGLLGFCTSSCSYSADQRTPLEKNIKKTDDPHEEVVQMLRDLAEGDLPTKLELVQKIESLHADSFGPEFIAALASPSPIVREVACRQLRQSNNRDAIKPLIKVLQSDPEAPVRRCAAFALGNFDSPDVVRAVLKSAQNDVAPEVRRFSVLSLGELKAAQTAVALGERLATESESTVTEGLIGALSEMKNTASVPYIISYFERTKDAASLAALGSIGGDQAGQFLVSRLQSGRSLQDNIRISDSLLRFEGGGYDQFLIGQTRTNKDAAVRGSVYLAAKSTHLPHNRWQPFIAAARKSAKQDESAEVRKAAEDLIKYGVDEY